MPSGAVRADYKKIRSAVLYGVVEVCFSQPDVVGNVTFIKIKVRDRKTIIYLSDPGGTP